MNKLSVALILTVIAISQQACATYIKGDLKDSDLRHNDFPATIVSLHEAGLDFSVERHMTTDELLRNIRRSQSDTHNSVSEIDIVLNYRVRDNLIQSEIMPLLTTITLGVLPLYSTSKVRIHADIIQDAQSIHQFTIRSRAHTFYGWIAIYMAERRRSPDLLNTHEGYGTHFFVLQEARSRAIWRISQLLHEK